MQFYFSRNTMSFKLLICNLFIQTSLALYSTLDPDEIPVENKPLYRPSLNELAEVLNRGMKNDYSYVDVNVVYSPDFRKAPYNLSSEGICGDSIIMEVGGPGFLLPFPNLTRIYDLKDMVGVTGRKRANVIGATSGPFPYVGVNSEEIVNIKINEEEIVQKSRIYKVNRVDGSPVEEFLPNNETRIAIMGHLHMSEGKRGYLLQVHVKRRVSDNDLISSIRTVLANHYGANIIGMGGIFWAKRGKLNQHIMPDFSKVAINNDQELNQWLYFYNMSTPLIGVGTFVTGNYSLDLRLQHFHTYSNHKEGGHYHVDVTPNVIEYLGYFVPAATVYRVDRPSEHRGFGRDK